MNASHTAAANIRAALARQQITKSDLARSLGVSSMWVTRRTNAEIPITLDDLARIAAALDVPMQSLLVEHVA